MPRYIHKDNILLEFEANKKRLRTEGRIVLDRVLNEALDQMAKEFNAGLDRGEVLRVESSPNELRRLLWQAARLELSDVV